MIRSLSRLLAAIIGKKIFFEYKPRPLLARVRYLEFFSQLLQSFHTKPFKCFYWLFFSHPKTTFVLQSKCTLKSKTWSFSTFFMEIGKLFVASELSDFIQYLSVFYNDWPCDWLLAAYTRTRACPFSMKVYECYIGWHKKIVWKLDFYSF